MYIVALEYFEHPEQHIEGAASVQRVLGVPKFGRETPGGRNQAYENFVCLLK
jgi:hypothetical protein